MIELFILDANGVPRGKLLHREELLAVYQSGRPLPSTILGLTLHGDDVENSGLVWDVGDIDCRAYPLAGSLVRLPWRQIPTAAVQVSMHPHEGMPAEHRRPAPCADPGDRALKADGFHPVMACELEFYLLDASATPTAARNRRWTPTAVARARPRSMACASWSRSNRSSPTSMPPARPGHSGAHGDFRIRPGPGGNHPGTRRRAAGDGPGRALQAPGQGRGAQARHAGLLHGQAVRRPGRHRHAHARQPGRRRGQQPVRQRRPGRHPAAAPGGGRHARHLLDSLLLFCPNANSYRRFQANSYAPLAPTWGVDNRTVSLRVPGGPANTRHIEHRICGADANPYLAAAAILAGIHRGIREHLDPGAPVEGNGYAQAKELLPTDWLTSLRALELSWARDAGAGIPRRVPEGQARRVPAVHGRGGRAGLALVLQA
jgi:glutamine synthetase